MINELENWTEVTRGLYRYAVAAKACYEIHILYWGDGTDILTACASLYLVGNWTSNSDKVSFFSREVLLEKQPVFECLEAAARDENNLNIYQWMNR